MNLQNEDLNTGILLVNKPIGISSFKIVAKIRQKLEVKKVGHAGTLDPFASGLLIIGVGKKYTKQLDKFQKLKKVYEVVAQLGEETDTLDTEGKILKKIDFDGNENEIKKILVSFLGKQEQVPPAFSAKKINGQRAYKLARQGLKVKLKVNQIEIYNMDFLNYNSINQQFEFRVECSKGTYIRSLVRDIGKALGSCAYTLKLKRTMIGNYSIQNAIDIDLKQDLRSFLIKIDDVDGI